MKQAAEFLAMIAFLLALLFAILFVRHFFVTKDVAVEFKAKSYLDEKHNAAIGTRLNPMTNALVIQIETPFDDSGQSERDQKSINEIQSAVQASEFLHRLADHSKASWDLYSALFPYRLVIEQKIAYGPEAEAIRIAHAHWKRVQEELRREAVEDSLRALQAAQQEALEAVGRERAAYVLNAEAVRRGGPIPCPHGWDAGCEEAWRFRSLGPKPLPSFSPATHLAQIDAVNQRSARDRPCPDPAYSDWPYVRPDLATQLFARKVRQNGGNSTVWGLLVIDEEAVEAALQIAEQVGVISEEETPSLRMKARATLFKENCRSVIAMHNSSAVLTLADREPFLISQRAGIGRLAGMSTNIGAGLRSGEVGLFMFEDRVCSSDVSFTIDLAYAYPCTQKSKVFFFWESTYDATCLSAERINVGANGNVAAIMAAAYARYVPQAQQLNASLGRDSGGTSLDLASVLGIALNLIQLLTIFK